MKAICINLARQVRRIAWALIVAYMLGLHNFYHGEDKTSRDIGITIENQELPGDGAPE